MTKPTTLDDVAKVLVLVGAANWGLVGAANVDAVRLLLGKNTVASRAVYAAVGLSAAYLIAEALDDKLDTNYIS